MISITEVMSPAYYDWRIYGLIELTRFAVQTFLEILALKLDKIFSYFYKKK